MNIQKQHTFFNGRELEAKDNGKTTTEVGHIQNPPTPGHINRGKQKVVDYIG